jgi:hypothetical protein
VRWKRQSPEQRGPAPPARLPRVRVDPGQCGELEAISESSVFPFPPAAETCWTPVHRILPGARAAHRQRSVQKPRPSPTQEARLYFRVIVKLVCVCAEAAPERGDLRPARKGRDLRPPGRGDLRRALWRRSACAAARGLPAAVRAVLTAGRLFRPGMALGWRSAGGQRSLRRRRAGIAVGLRAWRCGTWSPLAADAEREREKEQKRERSE